MHICLEFFSSITLFPSLPSVTTDDSKQSQCSERAFGGKTRSLLASITDIVFSSLYHIFDFKPYLSFGDFGLHICLEFFSSITLFPSLPSVTTDDSKQSQCSERAFGGKTRSLLASITDIVFSSLYHIFDFKPYLSFGDFGLHICLEFFSSITLFPSLPSVTTDDSKQSQCSERAFGGKTRSLLASITDIVFSSLYHILDFKRFFLINLKFKVIIISCYICNVFTLQPANS